MHKPQWALAVCIVLLLAAGFESGPGRRQAALIAVTLRALWPSAEAAVLVFASVALGVVGVSRLFRLDGRNRLSLATALAIAVPFWSRLAGGPVSDELFQRGGTTGMVRIVFEPDWQQLALFTQTGPALLRVGILPLIAVGAFAAFRRRSWGLAFLSLPASVLGVVAGSRPPVRAPVQRRAKVLSSWPRP